MGINYRIMIDTRAMKVGIIKCSDCGHAFEGRIGGTMSHEYYACEVCDSQKSIERSENLSELTCDQCGSRSVPGLNRMCPICKSRDTDMVHVTVYGD